MRFPFNFLVLEILSSLVKELANRSANSITVLGVKAKVVVVFGIVVRVKVAILCTRTMLT